MPCNVPTAYIFLEYFLYTGFRIRLLSGVLFSYSSALLGKLQRFLCTVENDIYGFLCTFMIASKIFCALLRVISVDFFCTLLRMISVDFLCPLLRMISINFSALLG